MTRSKVDTLSKIEIVDVPLTRSLPAFLARHARRTLLITQRVVRASDHDGLGTFSVHKRAKLIETEHTDVSVTKKTYIRLLPLKAGRSLAVAEMRVKTA